jgi:hypothetical protein
MGQASAATLRQASLNGGRHLHHNDRNSAQVELCAHGTRCPFERFAAFIGISAFCGRTNIEYAFFIAVLHMGE